MKLFLFFSLVVILLLTGCQSTAIYNTPQTQVKHKQPQKTIQQPVQQPVQHTNQKDDGYMIASWYGQKFHGKKTANGETYNMYDLTAAHRTLPFETKLKLINEKNNKSVIVRINDRGPVPLERDIDLSYKAAQTLGFADIGICKLKVIYLDE
jgi:rare lipoprotein A